MAVFSVEAIVKFKSSTGYDLPSLFLDFESFITNQRDRVIDFYNGLSRVPDLNSFNELNRLISEFDKLNNIIENNRDRFSHTLFWELIETISDMNTVLETIDNSSRWLRSAIAKNDFTPGIEVEHTLRMFQTLESVSSNIQGSTDPQNEWTSIALRNDLEEEDYTTSGGNNLKIGFRNRATVEISSVVDTIDGESIYGKDLKRKLEIDPTTEDLVVLSPKKTVEQSVLILGELKQGDTPEYPGEGIQAGLVTGSNRAAISYPILTRQITNTFQKDDTLKSIKITDIKTEEDSVSIETQVETRLGELITNQSQA